MRGVVAVVALTIAGGTAANAADLWDGFRGEPARPAFGYPMPHGRFGHPYFAEASRFDIYGYPVPVAPPIPVYAATGCPATLQPIYDAVGNMAGYAPVQGCR